MAVDILIILVTIYLFIGFFHSLKHVLNDDFKVFKKYNKFWRAIGVGIAIAMSFLIISTLWILYYIKDFSAKEKGGN